MPTAPAEYLGTTPEEVERRRAFARMLLEQGTDASPVGHPLQALARSLQGAFGGWLAHRAARDEQEGQSKALQQTVAYYSGKQAGVPATTATSAHATAPVAREGRPAAPPVPFKSAMLLRDYAGPGGGASPALLSSIEAQ